MTRYRDSRIYGLDEICVLLHAVDRHLTSPASVVIIGGAAAAFHGAESSTSDVDTHNALEAELQGAIRRALAETGLSITINRSAVADVPWNYEDRLERKLPELSNLQVWVVEKHDLALSKIVRCYEHDLQQLEEVHAHVGLELDVLVTRFRIEMGHVNGDPVRLRANFLELIGRLFGEMKRVKADQAIG